MARRFEPKMTPAQREALYARWRQAVERSLGWAGAGEA
jgi:glycerol kinase